jgi:hypothetical protein
VSIVYQIRRITKDELFLIRSAKQFLPVEQDGSFAFLFVPLRPFVVFVFGLSLSPSKYSFPIRSSGTNIVPAQYPKDEGISLSPRCHAASTISHPRPSRFWQEKMRWGQYKRATAKRTLPTEY